MPSKAYSSRRKKLVLAAIEDMGCPFTAQQLWDQVSKRDAGVSRATVYRILQKLREEGVIKDVILSHGLHVSIRTEATAYCVVECADCGRFRLSEELAEQVIASSRSLPLNSQQIAIHIRGVCSDKLPSGECRGRENPECLTRATLTQPDPKRKLGQISKTL